MALAGGLRVLHRSTLTIGSTPRSTLASSRRPSTLIEGEVSLILGEPVHDWRIELGSFLSSLYIAPQRRARDAQGLADVVNGVGLIGVERLGMGDLLLI
jgi:hypothetical protein